MTDIALTTKLGTEVETEVETWQAGGTGADLVGDAVMGALRRSGLLALADAAAAWRDSWAVERDGQRRTYGNPGEAVAAQERLLRAATVYAEWERTS